MKIYYNSSLWDKGKGHGGFPQKTNWRFEYGGTERCIPAVYRFPQGIVFDIITFLEEDKLRHYFQKYETLEEKLTPIERRCAEQEHPYQEVPIRKIWINGKMVEKGYSSSSSVSIPWAGEGDNLAFVRKAYSSILKDGACFACQRFCVPYPETDSKIQKLLHFFRLDRVKDIKLSTYPVQRFSPLDIHFEMAAKENKKMVSFKHPVTGVIHRLYFQNPESAEMPLRAGRNRSIYVMQSMYETEPALPQGDSLQFNSSIQYSEPPEDKFGPTAASSIGIIGGSDGPTSVFIAGKEKAVPCGIHGLPLHICFSVPAFHKQDVSHFVLEGINIKHLESREYSFQ